LKFYTAPPSPPFLFELPPPFDDEVLQVELTFEEISESQAAAF
jgi:hypothetical protein